MIRIEIALFVEATAEFTRYIFLINLVNNIIKTIYKQSQWSLTHFFNLSQKYKIFKSLASFN